MSTVISWQTMIQMTTQWSISVDPDEHWDSETTVSVKYFEKIRNFKQV